MFLRIHSITFINHFHLLLVNQFRPKLADWLVSVILYRERVMTTFIKWIQSWVKSKIAHNKILFVYLCRIEISLFWNLICGPHHCSSCAFGSVAFLFIDFNLLAYCLVCDCGVRMIFQGLRGRAMIRLRVSYTAQCKLSISFI